MELAFVGHRSSPVVDSLILPPLTEGFDRSHAQQKMTTEDTPTRSLHKFIIILILFMGALLGLRSCIDIVALAARSARTDVVKA